MPNVRRAVTKVRLPDGLEENHAVPSSPRRSQPNVTASDVHQLQENIQAYRGQLLHFIRWFEGNMSIIRKELDVVHAMENLLRDLAHREDKIYHNRALLQAVTYCSFASVVCRTMGIDDETDDEEETEEAVIIKSLIKFLVRGSRISAEACLKATDKRKNLFSKSSAGLARFREQQNADICEVLYSFLTMPDCEEGDVSYEAPPAIALQDLETAQPGEYVQDPPVLEKADLALATAQQRCQTYLRFIQRNNFSAYTIQYPDELEIDDDDHLSPSKVLRLCLHEIQEAVLQSAMLYLAHSNHHMNCLPRETQSKGKKKQIPKTSALSSHTFRKLNLWYAHPESALTNIIKDSTKEVTKRCNKLCDSIANKTSRRNVFLIRLV